MAATAAEGTSPLDEDDSVSSVSEFRIYFFFFYNPLPNPNKQSGSYVTPGMPVGTEGTGNT